MPFRIAFVSPHFGHVMGGAETNDLNLGRALGALGHEVTYFTVLPRPPAQSRNAAGVHVAPVEMSYWYDQAVRAPWLLGDLLRQEFERSFLHHLVAQKKSLLAKQDLILITGRPVLAGVSKHTGAKVLHSVRGPRNPRNFHYFDQVDAAIFWGGCEKQHPESLLKRIDHLDLRPALEHDIFYLAPPRPDLRAAFVPNAGDIVVVTAGRIDPIQQIDVIVAAAGQLVSEGLPLRLIVAGDGFVRAGAEALAAKVLPPDRYKFLGAKARTEMGDLLRAADIFIIDPTHTNHPLVIKEALACGRFVMMPDTGNIAPELKGKPYAQLFAPKSQAALTDALRSVIVERRFAQFDPAIAAAHVRADTWENCAAQILAWLERARHQAPAAA